MIIPPFDGAFPPKGTANGIVSDFVFNRSSIPGTTVTDALNLVLAQINSLVTGLSQAGILSLTNNRNVYVDSATGNDANTGSAGHPWQTLARAWADRKNYGSLLATYTVHLVGVGPYTLPNMVDSLAGDNGHFVILGDPAVEVTLATGTFDGNIAGYVVPTLAGLGESDEWGGECLKITSGVLTDARVQIATNTDTTITVQSKAAWFDGATAPGDTFEIRRPGTEIVVPANVAIQGWIGGAALPGSPRHVISNVKLTGADSLIIDTACVALPGVRVECFFQTINSRVTTGLAENPALVGASGTFGAFAWGLQSVSDGGWNSSSCELLWFALLVAGAGFFGGSAGIGDEVVVSGARLNSLLSMQGCGKIEAYGSGYIQARAKILCDANSVLFFFSVDQILNFDVTAGDCLRASSGSSMVLDTTTLGGAITGGTSDAEGGGLGCNARGGGRINWVNQTPTLTGGVLNQDIAAGPVPVANATLAANGDGEADPQTLSVVARITAAV